MNKILRKTEFGNPILRRVAKTLGETEIVSEEINQLISDMYYTLEKKRYGVGLAAPQVNHAIAISVIDTKPTPTRPDTKRVKLTMINPVITKIYGKKTPMWEGCISGPDLYAQVPRHERVRLQWFDAKGEKHEKDFDGFTAHVIQHEIDHLNGVLFVDRVEDTKSYMTFKEYKKMRKEEKAR